MNLFNKNKITVPIPNQQVDERDTMFARMARRSNTDAYNDYYSTNPKLKKKDDHIRSLTPLLQEGSKYYDEQLSAEAAHLFDSIYDIRIEDDIINN